MRGTDPSPKQRKLTNRVLTNGAPLFLRVRLAVETKFEMKMSRHSAHPKPERLHFYCDPDPTVPLAAWDAYSYLLPGPSTFLHSTSGRDLGIISCSKSQPASLQSSATTSSQEPSSSTSNSTWLTGWGKKKNQRKGDYGSRELETHSFGDIDLRDTFGQEPDNLRDRSNLEARTNANQQVHFVAILAEQALVKGVRKLLAKESDIGLHYFILAPCPRPTHPQTASHLHHPSFAEVHFFLLSTAVFTEPFLFLIPALRSLPLFSSCTTLRKLLQTSVTLGNDSPPEFWEDILPRNLILTLHARSGCERPMALYQLVGQDTGTILQVVDVLSVLGEELLFGLQQNNECVCGRELLRIGKYVLCY